MPKRTPEQKLARRIQAETGRRYTDCLAEAIRICSEQIDSHEPNNPTTPEIEAEYAALKTRWQGLYGQADNAHRVKVLKQEE